MKVPKVLRFPDYLRHLRSDIDELYAQLRKLNYQEVKSQSKQSELEESLDAAKSEIERLRIRNTELEHMVVKTSQKSSNKATDSTSKPSNKTLFANNHDLDAFYLEFENRFRGTESEIREKQTPYIDVFKQANVNKKLPVVDLGCGRGEFLELLHDNGFKAIGVDLNESMVQRAQERGFEAVLNDGISFLVSQRSDSLSGVTGFHLAEHIPFDQVLLLISEAYRCLSKGGILLLETPNPENVYVGAFTFHYDPSHLKPLPPAIMQFSALFKGFERADILRLQPELTEEEILKATKNEKLQDALRRLYGPRDYALVAYK